MIGVGRQSFGAFLLFSQDILIIWLSEIYGRRMFRIVSA